MKIYKVALVDDDDVVLTMIALALEKLDNIEVLKFNSGEDLLEVFDSISPDILVTDYYMDSVNKNAMRGSDLIIKLYKRYVNIPIIILSSQDNMKLALELSRFKLADYIEKQDGFANKVCKSIEDIISIDKVNGELNSADKVMKKDYKHLLKVSLVTVIVALISIGLTFFLAK